MADDPSYKLDQVEKVIASMSEIFDVVRLVDPIAMVVYTIEDGALHAEQNGCFHVWNKTGRCDNCISSKCFLANKRFSKFEFIDKDIYHVVAKPVVIEGKRYVLEVVTASDDDVLLSAFGSNDFVDRITDFNRKVYEDELTGLQNRRFINERFPLMVDRAQAEGASLAVAMIDVDDFKRVNDTYGHLEGDRTLMFVADVLRQAFRPSENDILARYGGDEFLVALQGVGRAGLEERLAAVPEILAARTDQITVSMGAYLPGAAELNLADAALLVQRADDAMYGIKTAGKNNWRIVE